MNNTALLQRYNLKATPQRLEIIKTLAYVGHINVDDLYAELKKKIPSISLSTIYKNVNTMMEKGFLTEVKLNGQKNVYELIKERHSHVVCTRCNQVIDINVNILEVLNKAKDISKFDLNESSLTFHGLCPTCLKN